MLPFTPLHCDGEIFKTPSELFNPRSPACSRVAFARTIIANANGYITYMVIFNHIVEEIMKSRQYAICGPQPQEVVTISLVPVRLAASFVIF